MDDRIHLGMILDGNRRYSRKRRIPHEFKHLQGAFNALKIIDYIIKNKTKIIKEVTLYTLSLDNVIKREKTEIKELFTLLDIFLCWVLESAKVYDVHYRVVGNYKKYLPSRIVDRIADIEKLKENSDFVINIALCYDGREELRQAAIKSAETKTKFEDNLYVKNNIDLVIRTGGNIRMSGFFPWQTTYAEWFFSNKMWPAFTTYDLENILKKYQGRTRRFGK